VTKMELQSLRQIWETRIADFLASGQSGAAWCAANDLKVHQLWYWLRKFSSHHPAKTTPATSTTSHDWVSFEWDKSPSEIPSPSVLLVRVGQAVIEVTPGFNPALLNDVVRALSV